MKLIQLLKNITHTIKDGSHIPYNFLLKKNALQAIKDLNEHIAKSYSTINTPLSLYRVTPSYACRNIKNLPINSREYYLKYSRYII